MIVVREYLDAVGRNEYRTWFNGLGVEAATKVTVALERIAQGNRSSIKAVGDGVSEYKIDWGPGYRIYFGKDGDQLVILLGGGIKKRQDRDIADAKAAWSEYKTRKRASQNESIIKARAKSRPEKTKLKAKRK
jgi:putative addiction module killer protein